MRELVRGDSVREVQKKVDRMKTRGWKQISDIKQDPSFAGYNVIEFVAAMETEERENTGRKWGKTYHLR